ncbi:MAG: hypothetical protein OEN50_13335 [Deltaproteobacteria bacterium]|nr:hypothetical protein [Deltaproteobacteria bacterium]
MNEGQIVGRRQKLRRMEVLRAADKEERTREWFEGKVPASDTDRQDRGQATRDLFDMGLLEIDDLYPRSGHPNPYCLTSQGRTFLKDVMEKIGRGKSIDWKRIREIEFPRSKHPLQAKDT